jgi:capsular exopolysaccharide synthesis family protein
VRNLRTSILMSNIDRPPQVMLVTSSVPGEGKTTTAIALARNLTAMEGKRVLLVEADMRRKSLRSYVENDTIISLIDVLMGQVDINHVDLWNDDLGVNVLAGSDAQMNATDLFASNKFGDLMAMLRRDYDHIVIDTPPVLAVPDARVIATHADAVIYAVHWSRTTRMQVRQGLEMLESIGISLTGTVLTQVDTKKMKSYGYGGQYGYDGYASKYYSEG